MNRMDVPPLEGYPPEIGLLLATIRDSTENWRKNLGQPPIEAIVWQPTADSYSIGALILHLIDCEDWWLRSFLAGNARDPEEVALFLSDETDQYEGRWPAPPAKPLSWYYELQDRIRERAFQSIRHIDPDQLFSRPDRNYECTPRWVVGHVLGHDSYTGGQAVALHELWKKLRGLTLG